MRCGNRAPDRSTTLASARSSPSGNLPDQHLEEHRPRAACRIRDLERDTARQQFHWHCQHAACCQRCSSGVELGIHCDEHRRHNSAPPAQSRAKDTAVASDTSIGISTARHRAARFRSRIHELWQNRGTDAAPPSGIPHPMHRTISGNISRPSPLTLQQAPSINQPSTPAGRSGFLEGEPHHEDFDAASLGRRGHADQRFRPRRFCAIVSAVIAPG
jgi:hypothetical protein